ncbi:MAG: translocase, partial [Planctomycetales bacterium]|nr:translocase [Planctomycetales bacterium]
MKLLDFWNQHRCPPLVTLRRRVRAIEARESQLRELNDESIHKQALALRYRARSGEPLGHLVEEGFALIREAARRTIGLRHHDVQLIGGLAMHEGAVVEMQTGEGKTLTATLPTALHAMTGRGAHVSTANDYLARRDAEEMTPVYEMLGLKIGIIQAGSSPSQRQQAYEADITYGTAKEFGFDFLRQRLKQRGDGQAARAWDPETGAGRGARPRYFMLVDEADALLLDEARTPLIVSSQPEGNADSWEALHDWSYRLANELEEERHFTWTPDQAAARLNAAGRRLVRSRMLPASIADMPTIDLYERVEIGLLVRFRYQCDRHYVVRDQEVVIVDEFTGRLAEGRRWRDGIHQMIETRERVPLSPPTGQAARITLQRFLSLYERLAGMTGTAANSRQELRDVYHVDVLKVPTHRPPQRRRLEDR